MKTLALAAILLFATGCAIQHCTLQSEVATIVGLDATIPYPAAPGDFIRCRIGFIRSETTMAGSGVVFESSSTVSNRNLFAPIVVTRSLRLDTK